MNAHASVANCSQPLVIDATLFDHLAQSGKLARVELRDGALYRMNAQHVPHARCKGRLFTALIAALPGRDLEVLVEVSVVLDDLNVPMPDIVVAMPLDIEGFLPLSAVRLIVEVSDSSLADDLGRKRALYARVGVPEYWVVDVRAAMIQQFALPSGDDYKAHASVRFGEPSASLTIDGLTVDTAALV